MALRHGLAEALEEVFQRLRVIRRVRVRWAIGHALQRAKISVTTKRQGD